ncbi:hypothetical protein GCM10027168_65150 [Streptomyces capparidis]
MSEWRKEDARCVPTDSDTDMDTAPGSGAARNGAEGKGAGSGGRRSGRSGPPAGAGAGRADAATAAGPGAVTCGPRSWSC